MRAPHDCPHPPDQPSSVASIPVATAATESTAHARDDGALNDLLARHNLQIFYGDLHNHTSYSDGQGTPEVALQQMRARGLDFAAITDHGETLAPAVTAPFDKWQALAAAIAQANEAQRFVALRGFEWSPDTQGHINVWSSGAYTNWHQTGDQGVENFYEWLATAEAAPGRSLLAGFNHPLAEQGICRAQPAPALVERLVVAECFNRGRDYGAGYFRLLDGGWHVGALGSSDHHGVEWGHARLPRTGLLAHALTQAALEAALRARHTFAANRPAVRLVLAGNGELMGARLTLHAREDLQLVAWFDELGVTPVAAARTRLELWTSGGRLLAVAEAQQVAWHYIVAPQADASAR